MSWTQSLIRISGYEVETLQKRMREIAERRAGVADSLAELDREEAQELACGRMSAEAGWYLIGFRQGCGERRRALQVEASNLEAEAQGARDALTEAFEAQKKYEQVADRLRLAERAEAGRREAAELDELGLRRRA